MTTTPGPDGAPRLNGAKHRVDAHHHVWDLARFAQGWIGPDEVAIDRSFSEAEFAQRSAATGIDAAVLVETDNLPGETAHLLQVADASPVSAAVVGWVDLTAADVADQIAVLRAGPGGRLLRGLRHQVQAEPDPGWLTRPDVVRGLRMVAQAGLVFELLVKPHQLPAALAVTASVDELRYVVAHAAKPTIATGIDDAWFGALAELGNRDHVTCKLSGLVTEAAWVPASAPVPTPAPWPGKPGGPGRRDPADPEVVARLVRQLRPAAHHVLASFGPRRTCVGTDWPVCLLAATHREVVAVTEALVADLSPAEQHEVWSATASRTYGIDAPPPAPVTGANPTRF